MPPHAFSQSLCFLTSEATAASNTSLHAQYTDMLDACQSTLAAKVVVAAAAATAVVVTWHTEHLQLQGGKTSTKCSACSAKRPLRPVMARPLKKAPDSSQNKSLGNVEVRSALFMIARLPFKINGCKRVHAHRAPLPVQLRTYKSGLWQVGARWVR